LSHNISYHLILSGRELHKLQTRNSFKVHITTRNLQEEMYNKRCTTRMSRVVQIKLGIQKELKIYCLINFNVSVTSKLELSRVLTSSFNKQDYMEPKQIALHYDTIEV
jgi:hypothetical protein